MMPSFFVDPIKMIGEYSGSLRGFRVSPGENRVV